MNTNPVFDSVKELLSQGDTDQGLRLLISFLDKNGAHAEYLRALRVIEANYNATKQEERKGMLDFSAARREYAKANDAILSILEDLIAGRNPNPNKGHTEIRTIKNKRLGYLVGGGILLLVGLIGGIFYTQNGFKKQKPEGPVLDCPKFRAEGFKILVLEFQKLSGEASKPELGIQTRIRDLTKKNKISTDVRLLSAEAFDGATPGTLEATELGKQCQADMIIWGQYEMLTDSISVDIRYAFTDPVWPPGVAMSTFKNISEIKSDQMKISNLDEAVFRLCTALALHENRMDLAEKWLSKVQNPNPREIQWKKVFQTMNDKL